jgi:hypothetical protein
MMAYLPLVIQYLAENLEQDNRVTFVIQPEDATTLDDPDLILALFCWTDFSTDAFETLLDFGT